MRLLVLKILSQILFLSMLIGQYNASIKTARMYEIQQNWDSAISIYNDILSKSPNNYQVIRSLKNLYKKSHTTADQCRAVTAVSRVRRCRQTILRTTRTAKVSGKADTGKLPSEISRICTI